MAMRPNIVFILIDDMGWRDLTCYGSSFYRTPNLDRLAAEGMLFTDAYAACPVCSPTRASILTGKYPARVGITNYIGQGHPDRARLIDAPYIDHLPTTELSLAAALREHGYATWHVGKWHLGPRPFYPENHGFALNIAGCDWGHPRNGYFSPWGIETLHDGPEGAYLTDRLTDEAIGLLSTHATKGPAAKPFFLNLWYYAVHTPIQARPERVAECETRGRERGLDRVPTFEEGEVPPKAMSLNTRVRRRLIQSDPVYAAMVETLDANIGRLLDTLTTTGQDKNTIVIFTSDNGGLATSEGSPTCNAPLSEGKGWMYEGGTREPLIVRWPGVVAPGSTCDVPVTSPDFYPTLLDAAGLPPRPAQHLDGVSITPLLRGERRLDREAVFWHYPHYGNQGGSPGASVRAGDWKLIQFFEDNRLELYNLREDIGEKHNLESRRPEIARHLLQLLEHWQNDVSAAMPTRNPDWPWQ